MIPVGWPSFYAERGWADIVKSAIFAGMGHVTQVRIVLFFFVYDLLRDYDGVSRTNAGRSDWPKRRRSLA